LLFVEEGRLRSGDGGDEEGERGGEVEKGMSGSGSGGGGMTDDGCV